MQRLYDWLRRKLGIHILEMDIASQYKSIGKIERQLGKARIGKRPLRHGEVERVKKRRRKRLNKVADTY